MRLPPVAAVVLLLAVGAAPWAPSSAGGDPPEATTSAARGLVAPEEAEDFALTPVDGGWVNLPLPDLRVEVRNEAWVPVPEASAMVLDGEALSVSWDASRRVLHTLPRDRLSDGQHAVGASLVFENRPPVELHWTFGVDTRIPSLAVAPLPEVTANRTAVIEGAAEDPNLDRVTVNGRQVGLRDGTFALTTTLWPGLNDFIVEAWDRANNLARHTATVRLETPEIETGLRTWEHLNASFAIDIPEGWQVQTDVVLKSGNRAALAAVGPLEPGVQTTLIVLSERSGLSFPRTRALQWMNLVLSALEVSGDLRLVVGQPRVLEEGPGSVAVGATFLRDHPTGVGIAFMRITMVWSHPHDRQWVLLSTVDSERAHEEWPFLAASLRSFHLLDEGVVEFRAFKGPDLLLPTLLLSAASVALVTLLAVVLFEGRIRAWWKERRERWRPPRNWRL